jgi:UDP-N-acetylmuramoyl-tripeptide--D-alanyl-D-alanine ligase
LSKTDYSQFSIGQLNYELKPEKLHPREKALYALASQYGLNFFCFTLKDINLEKNTINGLFWDDKDRNYVQKEVPFPDIVADPPDMKRHAPKSYAYLAKNCHLMEVHLGSKRQISELVKTTPFASYIIDTWRYKKVNLEIILSQHKTIVLKPEFGIQGAGVIKLTKLDEGMYQVHSAYDTETMTSGQFKKKYDHDFREQDYIVQPFINSTTVEGNPFDIRLHIRRKHEGKWGTFLMFPVIGRKAGVVSNFKNISSACLNTPAFLEAEFGDEWKNVHNEIWRIIDTFPDEFQKRTKQIVERITIDVGINRDNNNEIKFFEVDTEPNMAFWHFETAEASIHYYMFRLNILDKIRKGGEQK